MKKIFTLAAAALVGISSAFAAQFKAPNASQKVDFKLDQAKIAAFQQAATNEMLNPNSENVIRKSATINGETWDAVITLQGNDFWLQFVDEESYDFARLWYCVYLRVSKQRQSQSDPVTYYNFLAFWPTNEVLSGGEGFGVPADADPKAPYDVELFFNTGLPMIVLEKYYMGIDTDDNGNVYGFGLFNLNATNQGETEPWFSKYGMYPSYHNGTICCPGTGSKIQWDEYEEETNYLQIAYEGSLYGASGNLLTQYSLRYEGTGYIDGFKPFTKNVEANELHVVNCGEWSSAYCEDHDLYIYDVDWGPLQRFYILFAGPGFTYPNEEFTATTYPDAPWRIQGTNEPVNYLQGAVYSAPGATPEEAGWTLIDIAPEVAPSGTYYIVPGAPKAGNALYGGYNGDVIFYSEVDGMQCFYSNYSAILQPGTRIAMGVKDEGFYVRGLDQYKDNVNYYFKGDVTYHYDSADYSKVKTFPAIGNMSGVENVEVEAGEAVYYDLQGRKVAGELVPGIYIRRAGAKAEKVLVK